VGINRGMPAFILGLTLTGWAETSRIISEQTRLLRQQPFIESAKSLGGNDDYILARHILPQVMPLVWNLLAFEISSTLLVAAELGFLGYFIGGGVWTEITDFVAVNVEGLPELGQMLSSALLKLTDPSALIAVGGTIFITILGFNLLGEGLRINTNPERIIEVRWKRFLGERWGEWVEFRFIPLLGDWFSLHLKIIVGVFLGVLLVLIGLFSLNLQPSITAVESPVILAVPGDHLWASAGQNSRNTRCTPVVGPRENKLLWFYHAGGNLSGGPVVKADGTIILASINKKLAAISPEGIELWRVDLDEIPVGAPALGERGEIYVADKAGGLATFAPNGGRLWYFSEKRGREAVSGPVVASDGTIYYNRLDLIQALDLFGKPLWQSPSVGEYLDTVPALSPKESFLFVKKLALSAESGARLALEGMPVDNLAYLDPEYFVGADNSTYFRKGSDIYRWRSTENGVELDKPIGWGYNISNTPVFPSDQGATSEGILWMFYGFESGFNNRLVSLDQQGRVLSNVSFNFVQGTLVGIDGEAVAYICASNSGFKASCHAIQLGSDQTLWDLNFGNNAKFIGGAVVTGRLYLALKTGYLVAIGEPQANN